MTEDNPQLLRSSLIDMVRIIVEHCDPNKLARFQRRQFDVARDRAGFPLEYHEPKSEPSYGQEK